MAKTPSKTASEKHTAVEIGAKWLDKLRAAAKREESFIKSAARAESIYLNEQKNGARKQYFNILHSNVETIVPAIYSNTPKPDIRRRFGDSDPVAKSAAQMLERAITVQIDDGVLDVEMERAAWSAFVPGRAVLRIRFVNEAPDTGEREDEIAENVEEAAIREETEDDDSSPTDEAGGTDPQAIQRLTYECVPWQDFRFGPAKRWQDVPWVAFKHMVPEEQIKEWTKDEAVQAQIASINVPTMDGDEDNQGDVPVWEVWCKNSKTVKFIRERDGVIYTQMDDPLGLDGFFPCTAPMQPIEKVGELKPVTPYEIYEELAVELDDTTRRIKKLIQGVKVRGGAAAGEMLKGIAEIAGLDDNEIAEIRGVEAFAQQGGLEKGITWWPIEKAIEAIQTLAVHRDSVKATIYEVTGISDIVRGASNAAETATAQQIKSQWGSLRIQKMQGIIARSVRELFIMSAELIATKFTPQTLTAITGIEYTSEIDAIFKSRVQRVYRIDIETDSTIKADMTKSKMEMTQFLQGTAQFIQSVGPAVQAGMMPAPLAVEIYSSFARVFRLGKQADDALEQMAMQAKQPQQPQIPPEVQQQIEQGMQELQRLQQENQQIKADKSSEMAKLEMDREKHAMSMQQAQEKHAMDLEQRKVQHDQSMQMEGFKAEQAKAAAVPPPDVEGLLKGVQDSIMQFGQMLIQHVDQGNAAVLKAVTAPREVKAVRGPDGKMSGAVSTVKQLQ